MSDRVLLADIGGTNARFALMDDGAIGPIEHLRVADFKSSVDAVASFLWKHKAGGHPSAAVMDVAGAIEKKPCALTHNHWVVDGAGLGGGVGLRPAQPPNDF